MGSGWVASSTCDQLPNLAEGAWEVYSKGENTTYLAVAYDIFSKVLTAGVPGSNISAVRIGGVGKQVTALVSLQKMAAALGKAEDASAWGAVLAHNGPRFTKQWCDHTLKWGGGFDKETGVYNAAVTDFCSALAPKPWFKDEWAETQAEQWMLNSDYGFCSRPPGAVKQP
jgi:hypothetical protein